MKNTIHHGDCLELMKNILDGSVDLILTDPPYGTIKGMGLDGYDKNTTKWDNSIKPADIFENANRVLRKNGKLVLFSQEPYTTELIKNSIPNIPFCYRMIWKKDHFANALVAKKAPVSYYEDILVFSKTNEFEGLHPIRPYAESVFNFIGKTKTEIIKNIGQKADHFFRFKSSQFDLCTNETYNNIIDFFGIEKMKGFKEFSDLEEINSVFNSVFNLWEGKKYKSNILEYKKDYTGLHPTQKPVLLLEDLIKTFSNEGNTVLDFTMGSGSTGVACENTNRNFIGIEMDEKYFNIAKTRLNISDGFQNDLDF